jgi:hypothetical protein
LPKIATQSPRRTVFAANGDSQAYHFVAARKMRELQKPLRRRRFMRY